MSDIEINRSVKARPIQDVADQLGIQASELLPYGKLKAKVSLDVLERLHPVPLGKYVLVTAINPTPLGEGKTTTSIGLAMGLSRLGHRTAVTLRQPSLGPVFGIKGGGTGGGRAQVLPMEEIKLHVRVAENAWAGSEAGQIRLHERRDDLLVKIAFEIEREMRDLELPRHPARVGKIIDRATAAVRRIRVREIVVHLH